MKSIMGILNSIVKILRPVSFFSLFLILNTAYATEDYDIQVKYFWTMPWNLQVVDMSLDNVGSFVIHNTIRDDNGRERKDSKNGRISEEENQALQDLIMDTDIDGLLDEYNNCAADLPSNSITFEIDNQDKAVVVYEAGEDILKDCKSPQPPENLASILKCLKGLVAKYNTSFLTREGAKSR